MQTPVHDIKRDHACGAAVNVANDTWAPINLGGTGGEPKWDRTQHPEEKPRHPLGPVDRVRRGGDLSSAVRPEGYVLGEQRDETLHVATHASLQELAAQPLLLLW